MRLRANSPILLPLIPIAQTLPQIAFLQITGELIEHFVPRLQIRLRDFITNNRAQHFVVSHTQVHYVVFASTRCASLHSLGDFPYIRLNSRLN